MGENRSVGAGFKPAPAQEAVSTTAEEAISSAQRYLLSLQHADGYWCGELEADTTLESDTLKLDFFLGRQSAERNQKLTAYILSKQLPDGGWNIFAGGPAELNATIKAYFALKLTGHSPDASHMKKAAQTARRLGGLERINSFEKTYLAVFGLYPWSEIPALPPEIILLPNWFAFNTYEVSAWTRTILVPLSIIYATRPSCAAVSSDFLDELWATPQRKSIPAISPNSLGGKLWRNFFLGFNSILKLLEHSPWKPLRAHSLRTAKNWILERLADSDGLGAIYPSMINVVIALKGLGYEDGNPIFEETIRQVHDLEIEEKEPGNETIRVQPCFSPVWDTALALYALSPHPSPLPLRGRGLGEGGIQKGIAWLLSKEVRTAGDWKVKNPSVEPSGWFFEFRNAPYPDVDDAAMVLLALLSCGEKLGARPLIPMAPVIKRGVEWILSMQNEDGGWSSFDKNNNCVPLTFFPFADHNAMLDPSACDITGRVLELLGKMGYKTPHPAVNRAVAFLLNHQEPDGPWFGRWGVNYIYGSCFALRGLRAAGIDLSQERFQRAADWIRQCQNTDGGWGESCSSYDDPATKGKGPSTASQTAWALMALMAAGDFQTTEFQRGVQYLVHSQLPDGSWKEDFFTGTGFPKVFYLKYHLYSIYFPLIALNEVGAHCNV
ncbi:MAG: squalene--hopene cyclase, partial [Candidatus Omnitrophica bacterium]|nr:squalene--hopene cyclase [Candidatus Omnitrophota bacterium]